jgi:hypothetical protein
MRSAVAWKHFMVLLGILGRKCGYTPCEYFFGDLPYEILVLAFCPCEHYMRCAHYLSLVAYVVNLFCERYSGADIVRVHERSAYRRSQNCPKTPSGPMETIFSHDDRRKRNIDTHRPKACVSKILTYLKGVPSYQQHLQDSWIVPVVLSSLFPSGPHLSSPMPPPKYK